MCRYLSKDTHGAAIQHVQEKYKNKVDIKYNDATLIKCVLRAVLNDARDGESLACSGKSSHNEDTAKASDLPPQDLLVLILLNPFVSACPGVSEFAP